MDKTLETNLTQLQETLDAQLAGHERLAQLLADKRIAVRQADHRKMTALCQLENQQVQRISELEKQRLTQVATLTQLVEPDAGEPLKLDALALRLPSPHREKLLSYRHQLRERMLATQQEARTLGLATESLMRHMAGLIQKVSAVCTGVNVYSAKGAPPPQAMAVSTFSMTA